MTAAYCNAPVDGMIAPLLNEVDCQIATYVETTYGTLFGPFGFLEPALTAALTLYIGFYGFQLITGRGALSLSGLAPKVLLIGLVLAFATRWGAYQAVFLNLFYGGADEIAAAMLGGGHDSVFDRLDAVLKEIIRLANEWNMTAAAQPDAFGAAPASACCRQRQPAVDVASSAPHSASAVRTWCSRQACAARHMLAAAATPRAHAHHASGCSHRARSSRARLGSVAWLVPIVTVGAVIASPPVESGATARSRPPR